MIADKSCEVVETPKMKVELYRDKVVKVFKESRCYKKRYTREKRALQLLSSVSSTPDLLTFCDERSCITMCRLKGRNVDKFSDKSLLELKHIIAQMLAAGVARHSLPPRDILVDDEDNVAVVDFERVTLKEESLSFVWKIAVKVTEFHLLRLLHQHNRGLLTDLELKKLQRAIRLREKINKVRQIRKVFRNLRS